LGGTGAKAQDLYRFQKKNKKIIVVGRQKTLVVRFTDVKHSTGYSKNSFNWARNPLNDVSYLGLFAASFIRVCILFFGHCNYFLLAPRCGTHIWVAVGHGFWRWEL